MSRLPNELIIRVYSYLDLEETCKATIIFPSLSTVAKNFIVKIKDKKGLWRNMCKKGSLEVVKWLHENRRLYNRCDGLSCMQR